MQEIPEVCFFYEKAVMIGYQGQGVSRRVNFKNSAWRCMSRPDGHQTIADIMKGRALQLCLYRWP